MAYSLPIFTYIGRENVYVVIKLMLSVHSFMSQLNTYLSAYLKIYFGRVSV